MRRTAAFPVDEPLRFKLATDPWEIEQVHRLNYRTFVEEIPQHEPNAAGALIDRFDGENAYVICSRGDRVLGMIAVRGKRPFSLESKLADLDSYLPPGRSVCEIRLLAVEPEHRTGVVFRGLVTELMEYCLGAGFDLVVISGTVRQLKLYRHLGFTPFGPLVGTEEARYQPMYLTREAFEARARAFLRQEATEALVAAPRRSEPVAFLPGPVPVAPEVWQAFTRPPVSHRHPRFADDLRITRDLLCRLAGAARVQLLVGSGSLANDVVAGQLSLLDSPGLVLANGEFGERLVDHARRAGLRFSTLAVEWGRAFDPAELAAAISALPGGGWCWTVHCETSTGVLNDLPLIARLCAAGSVRLAADCISSIGTVPVDLSPLFLASGVSGKGIGGLPGLSMVFHGHPVAPSPRLPRYLDLGLCAESGGVPFTHSSNLVAALRAAAERTLARAPFDELAQLAAWLRGRLRALDYHLVAPEAHASPGIVTIAAGHDGDASLGERLVELGFELSFRSGYLRRRGWVQIALMGECSRQRLEPLLVALTAARESGPR